ncbi:hypothetical protein L195_g012445, partial [Trifolium pratense]
MSSGVEGLVLRSVTYFVLMSSRVEGLVLSGIAVGCRFSDLNLPSDLDLLSD